MSNSGTRISRATAISVVEQSKRLLRQTRQAPSSNRKTGHVGIDTQKLTPLSAGHELEFHESCHIFFDQIVSEERPANIETAPVAPLASK